MARNYGPDEARYAAFISEGEANREKNADDYKRWLGYLKNKCSLADFENQDFRAFINLAYMNWANLRPAIYFKNPQFKAAPRPGSGQGRLMSDANFAAVLMENILTYYLHEKRTKREFKLCTIEALVLGISVFKQGYHIPTKDIKKKKQNLKKLMGLSDAMAFDSEEVQTAIANLEEADRQALALDDIPDKETWWGKWTSIRNLLVPSGYGTWLSEQPWLIERIEKRLPDAHDSYPRIKDRNIEPTLSSTGEDGKADTYLIYEIWDWNEKKLVHLVPDKEKKTIVKENSWPRGLEKYPYEELRLGTDVPGEFYPQPDAKYYERVMNVVSETMSTSVEYLRRYKAQYWDEVGLDEETKAMIENPVDGSVITARKKMPQLMDVPKQTPDAQNALNRLLTFSDQLAGVTRTRRGTGAKLTATQVEAEEAGLDLREEEKRDNLEDFFTSVGRTQAQLIQKNMSNELIVTLSPREAKGFNLANPWHSVKPEEIDAELLIWVVPNSSIKADVQNDSLNLEKWFNLSFPNADMIGLDKRVLWQKFSEKSLRISREEIEEVMLPEQSPDAMGLAKYENQMFVQGMAVNPPDPQERHMIHLQAHQGLLDTLNPEKMQQTLIGLQGQAQQYIGRAVVPGDIDKGIAELRQRMQQAPAIANALQQHIAAHQNFQKGGAAGAPAGPLNYNLAAQKPSGGTTITGGSTRAEQQGGMQ